MYLYDLIEVMVHKFNSFRFDSTDASGRNKPIGETLNTHTPLPLKPYVTISSKSGCREVFLWLTSKSQKCSNPDLVKHIEIPVLVTMELPSDRKT